MIRLSANKRSIIYSLIATLSFYLIIDAKSLNSFILAITVNMILILIEIYSLKLVSINKLQQLNLPIVNIYPKYLEYFYHSLIPALLLISFSTFVYFNPVTLFIPFILILFFLVISILYINLRAYLEDKFQIEISTHFIYAFAIFFAFFSLTNTVLNLASLHSLPLLIVTMFLLVIYILLYAGIFIENLDINIKLLVLSFVSSVLLTIVAGILFEYYSSILRTSFITTIIFYFTVALTHHKSEGTLSFGIIVEYAAITALSLTMLYGIQ